MKELTKLLDLILGQTTFHSPSAENISTAQLRIAFERNGWHDEEIIETRKARPKVPDELLAQLNDHLRSLLQEFIDPHTDQIGHAFPLDSTRVSPLNRQHRTQTFQPNGLMSIGCVSALEDFSRGMIKGAVVIGAERVTNLLSGWLRGEPVRYGTSALLNGQPIREALTPMDGICIEPLPLSTTELPADLPSFRGMSIEDYLGRTVVSIGSIATPALFRPQAELAEQRVQANTVGAVDIDTVVQSLSLEFDSYFDVAFLWNDYQDLGSLDVTGGGNRWSTGNSRIRSWSAPVSFSTDSTTGAITLRFMRDQQFLDLSKAQIARTLGELKTLRDSDKTRIAISRWAKSRDSSEHPVDRFIDLRIALESLYLRSIGNEKYRGEMRFRLSMTGAWHLGLDVEERNDIRKTLLNAYDAASQAVHSGNLDYRENQQLLTEAQDLCRRGILKLLKEGPPGNWGALILGIENE